MEVNNLSSQNNDVIIGLEVHIQLTNLKTKLFCSCSTNYRGTEPNTFVCPICIGLPGSLPVVNKKVVEFATRLALALDCKINHKFWFFRKNYHYPDLPKGFQITQYNKAGGKAFADGGKITVRVNNHKKEVMLNRIHLEEDPARLVHKGNIAISPFTLVDYNRSGVCLIEIVSKPVIDSPEEAREFLKQLKSIVQYTGISDLDLQGSVRVDANISIKGNERSEVKNINSFKEVERALSYEIVRQKNALKRGKVLIQETRHWDDKRKITISLRSKEFEADYRYFPEQDLVPLEIDNIFIQKVKEKLPEMPNERALRLRREYMLSEFDSENLVLDKEIADFYENGANSDPSFGYEEYKQYCNWLMNNISGWLNENNTTINNTKLTPKHVVDLIKNIRNGKITTKIAKTYIDEMMKGTSVSQIIKKKGKKRIYDEKIIEKLCRDVIEENPNIVKDFRKNLKALEALIGRVMAKTKGQADAKITREVMLELLEKSKKVEK
ncbi:MAG: Asp-tRNA(Asn)/Glu-tRNA(Gln) amidotransferase GatCAB subunit B [Promethearchaeota archaeon Loki_b31]|nr:MAG: Asp-tRNA(Asn)/Glu-tRNA(Gln) amidotransferase GatCAB subunit B [Candidatus Lokiarchaeota archaeon Loki_b31]